MMPEPLDFCTRESDKLSTSDKMIHCHLNNLALLIALTMFVPRDLEKRSPVIFVIIGSGFLERCFGIWSPEWQLTFLLAVTGI